MKNSTKYPSRPSRAEILEKMDKMAADEAAQGELHWWYLSNMTKVNGHRAENGKWIKPDDYSPADLAAVLTAQGA